MNDFYGNIVDAEGSEGYTSLVNNFWGAWNKEPILLGEPDWQPQSWEPFTDMGKNIADSLGLSRKPILYCADPVNAATGNYVDEETDISLVNKDYL
jgi:hypothetical protein